MPSTDQLTERRERREDGHAGDINSARLWPARYEAEADASEIELVPFLAGGCP